VLRLALLAFNLASTLRIEYEDAAGSCFDLAGFLTGLLIDRVLAVGGGWAATCGRFFRSMASAALSGVGGGQRKGA